MYFLDFTITLVGLSSVFHQEKPRRSPGYKAYSLPLNHEGPMTSAIKMVLDSNTNKQKCIFKRSSRESIK